MRFVRAAALFVLLAVVFVPGAAALDFNDDSEEAPRGEVGLLYHFELQSHGGCDDAPYHYVVESGNLPPGLKLAPESYNLPDKRHTGLIDGMPTQGGTWSAWIALKDYCKQSAELLFTFDIWPRRFSISTESLPAAMAGSPYSAGLQAGGVRSVITWSLTKGSLPAGLTLNKDGTIAGTPTAAGESTFTVTATGVSTDPSADGTRLDAKQFTLHVNAPLTASLSRSVGEVGVPFRAALSGSGGHSPYTWSAAGSLPAGLSLGARGVLSGRPSAAGTYTVQLTVRDSEGNPQTITVTIRIAPRLGIVTRALRVAVGRAAAAHLVARGGVRPVRWTVVRGRLPAGIRLSARTGLLTGVAHTAGSVRLTVRARDAVGGSARKTVLVSAG